MLTNAKRRVKKCWGKPKLNRENFWRFQLSYYQLLSSSCDWLNSDFLYTIFLHTDMLATKLHKTMIRVQCIIEYFYSRLYSFWLTMTSQIESSRWSYLLCSYVRKRYKERQNWVNRGYLSHIVNYMYNIDYTLIWFCLQVATIKSTLI